MTSALQHMQKTGTPMSFSVRLCAREFGIRFALYRCED
jgi:hypothetical protein